MVEPFGDERADLRAGSISATIANVHRPNGKPPFGPDDFTLKFGDVQSKTQTVEEQLAIFKEFAAAHNASLKKEAG